uniref:Uncharacterized protein dst1 n=1 Tax=Coprinopsis cinerea TaxID=5346 RepID=Q4W6X2_COPCI|nr:hypothetical protein [Coprinopsis cinerea]
MAYDDYYTSTQQYNSSSGSAFSFLDSDPPIIDTTSIASGHHVPQSHQDLFSEPVTFQMPAFMQETNTVPSLASGGGALFYPFGPPPTTGKDWMPYSVYQDEPSCKTAAAAPVIHTQIYDPASAQQQTGVVAFDNPGAAPFEYEPIPAPLPTNPARDTHLDSFLSNSGALMQTQASNEGQQSQQGFDEAPLEQPQQPHPQLELVEGSQMGDGVVHPTPAAAQNSVHHHPNNALQALPNHEHGIPSLAPPPPPPPPPLPLAPPSSLVSTSFSTAASTLGLPIYSASGFDLLSILARVATRPYPRVQLGPVDLTCSFVVVDTRRQDHPIVYCSPSFLKLTGYPEDEVIGRNCRFLQSPTGKMEQGEPRPDPATQTAAAQMKKCLNADKECQLVLTNYRKDGTPFTNLVTVIPIPGGLTGAAHEENEVVFHVGFQVDMTQQPNVILEKLRNGSYLIDYSSQSFLQPPVPRGHTGAVATRERRSTNIPKIVISKELKKLLNDPTFVRSIPITTTTNHPPPTSSALDMQDVYGGNHPLHMMLLEMGPDFIHVVSLKGSFLYVAPSVRRVLGYEPDDLVGKSISDLAHPEDVVPLMRELKESSSTGLTTATTTTTEGAMGLSGTHAAPTIGQPRTVDLLFRARTKNGCYVWVESRGRLHVEPGKGRKAIILSGRAREIPKMSWGLVIKTGGLAKMVKAQRRVVGSGGVEQVEEVDQFQEWWGTMSPQMVMLMIGKGFPDVMGYSQSEFHGRNFKLLLDSSSSSSVSLSDVVQQLGTLSKSKEDCVEKVESVKCRVRHRDGHLLDVVVNVYRPERDVRVLEATRNLGGVLPAHLIYQVRKIGAETYPLTDTSSSSALSSPSSTSSLTSSSSHPSLSKRFTIDPGANMFEELEVSRGSSWQYELQQLKFANQRLRDDIKMLEAAVRAHKGRKNLGKAMSSSSSSTSGSSSVSPPASAPPTQQHFAQQQMYGGGGGGGMYSHQPFVSGAVPYFVQSAGSGVGLGGAALPSRTSSLGRRQSISGPPSHLGLQPLHPSYMQPLRRPGAGMMATPPPNSSTPSANANGNGKGRSLPPVPLAMDWTSGSGGWVQRIQQEARYQAAQQVQQAQEYSGSQHGQHSTTRQLQHGHGHGNGGGSGSGQGHGLGHGHYQQQQQQHHSQMMHQQQHQHQQRVGVGMKRPWGAVDR